MIPGRIKVLRLRQDYLELTTMNWLPVEAISPTEARDTTVKGVELWMGCILLFSHVDVSLNKCLPQRHPIKPLPLQVLNRNKNLPSTVYVWSSHSKQLCLSQCTSLILSYLLQIDCSHQILIEYTLKTATQFLGHNSITGGSCHKYHFCHDKSSVMTNTWLKNTFSQQ